MKLFREWLREKEARELNENFIQNKKEIEELMKKEFSKNFKSIVAIGSTIDMHFDYSNKKEASKSSNITYIEKALNTIVKVQLNKSSKDYKNGYSIESTDWKKDSAEDEHSLYVSFK